MKKRISRLLVTALVVMLSSLFIAPASILAQPVLVSIEVTPVDPEITALGQTQQFTATGTYDDDSTADITALVAWSSTDLSVASIDASGLATAVKEGFIGIEASLDGVSGWSSLTVLRPYLWVNPGLPGESTGIGFGVGDCGGLAWSLVVKDSSDVTVYSSSGTVPSDEWWDYNSNASLVAGDYTATLTVGGTLQDTVNFSVWDHEANLEVNPGYSGEETKITLNATSSSGKEATLWLLKYVASGDYWETVDESSTTIDSDPWSYTATYNLPKGKYLASLVINDKYEDGKEFSIVDRGTPQPPVVEKKEEKKQEEKKQGPAINKKSIGSYEKTASGFVTLFYNRFLVRPPESEGLNAWISRIGDGSISGKDLVKEIIFGEECQTRIGDYSDSEFITFLYNAIFNRNPEDLGYQAWMDRMASGMTREEVVSGFSQSDEFVKLCESFNILP